MLLVVSEPEPGPPAQISGYQIKTEKIINSKIIIKDLIKINPVKFCL